MTANSWKLIIDCDTANRYQEHFQFAYSVFRNTTLQTEIEKNGSCLFLVLNTTRYHFARLEVGLYADGEGIGSGRLVDVAGGVEDTTNAAGHYVIDVAADTGYKNTRNLEYNNSYHIAFSTGLAVEPCLFDDFGMAFRSNAKLRFCVEAQMVPTHLSIGGQFAPTATHDHFDAAVKNLHWSYKLEQDGIDYCNDVARKFEFNDLALA
ncbi:hypothetical protein RF11_07032 [Thelohanellus kitauei]|uniref:Uncharacterized protein n=1 Tax=Thelohanellus kitauei TaxID=669202 RepID=A0A0C2N5C3_THEKT|nr:hypothetical protein RF11_07032 [Thelohanellus kitauei]